MTAFNPINAKDNLNPEELASRTLDNEPAWYDSARKAAIVGKILVALGVVLAAAAIAGGIMTSGPAMIALTTIGPAASLAALSVGIHYVRKDEFWNNPEFKKKKVEEIENSFVAHGYDKTMNDYGQMINDHELLTKDRIREILWKKIWPLTDDLTADLDNRHKDKKTTLKRLVKDGVIQPEAMTQDYISVIAKHPEWTFADFIERYGWQVFGLEFVQADTAITERSTIKDFAQKSLQKCNNLDDLSKNFITLDDVLNYELISDEKWRALFDKQLESVTSLYDFKCYFISNDSSLWEFLDKLWIQKGIPIPQKLKDLAHKYLVEQHFNIYTVINRYDWNLFEFKLLEPTDIQVQKAIRIYLNGDGLYHFLENLDKLNTYQLLTQAELAKLNCLRTKQIQFKNELQAANNAADNAYLRAVNEAKNDLQRERDRINQTQRENTSNFNTTVLAATAMGALATDQNGRNDIRPLQASLIGGATVVGIAGLALNASQGWQANNRYQTALDAATQTRNAAKARAEQVYDEKNQLLVNDWKEFRMNYQQSLIPITASAPEELPPGYSEIDPLTKNFGGQQ